jgi:hypothetical protein
MERKNIPSSVPSCRQVRYRTSKNPNSFDNTPIHFHKTLLPTQRPQTQTTDSQNTLLSVMPVAFTPSQLSITEATSPITFRQSPFRLFLADLGLIIRLLPYAIQIILPFQTDNVNGELYLWNARNLISMILHFFLFVCSICGGLLAPVVFFLIPGVGFVVYILAFACACAVCNSF